MQDKLTIDDLRQMFAGDPRDDHPGRRSAPMASRSDDGLTRRDRGIRCTATEYVDGKPQIREGFYGFTFEPNPPGCRGIRRRPR